MQKPKFLQTATSIIAFLFGRSVTVSSSHPMFDEISDELKKGENADPTTLDELIDVEKAVILKTGGKVSVTADTVFYNGQPVGSDLSRRILKMLAEGYDIEPWVLFMDNVMKNPIKSAQEELHLFLESGKMPITPDGHFLAFKAVNKNLTSIHDGETQHVVGDYTSMPRENVNPDRHQTCARGLHFCSQGYLSHYSDHNATFIVVKINPEDVVAIPSDYSNQKGRAWKYLTLCTLNSKSEVNSFEFGKTVLGTFKGVDTFEAPELDEPADEVEDRQTIAEIPAVKPKTKPYNDMTARQFLKALKREGGARPYARANELAKSTVQDWAKKARSEIGE